MSHEKAIARNYATAFLNSFFDDISLDDFSVMCKMITFWQERKQELVFLQRPWLTDEKKIEILNILLDNLSAPKVLGDLFALLVRHKRIALIRDVLGQICLLYREKKNILFFTITSTHPLSDEQLVVIKKFLAHKTGKTILFECAIDTKLIAGIRCQSGTLVWEYSVHKQLDDLRRQLILQGAT